MFPQSQKEITMSFITKNLFGSFVTAALVLFTTSFAFADSIEERAEQILNSAEASCVKEAAAEIKNLIKDQVTNARRACAELRDCKKLAKAEKKECKNGCKGLKGKAKAQCKKECRKDKRADVKDCRAAYKTPACKKARKGVVKGVMKGIGKLAKSEACRKAIENLKELK
jgi:hypothetical protein